MFFPWFSPSFRTHSTVVTGFAKSDKAPASASGCKVLEVEVARMWGRFESRRRLAAWRTYRDLRESKVSDVKESSRTDVTVSVLIATYNGARFIEQQLESIRQQTRPANEVLIWDDGSTDTTVAIVQTYIQRHRLTHWSIKINTVNLGSAMNILAHISEPVGEFVYFADQDDIWHPEKVRVMTQHLVDKPDVVMVVSRTDNVDEFGHASLERSVARRVNSGSRIHRRSLRQTEYLTLDDFIGYTSVPLHAMCVRSSFLQEVASAGEYPSLNNSLGPDWYIGLLSTVMGRCLLIADRLVHRRVHGANISLGGLRKETALSVNAERRILMLTEAGHAHRAILANEQLAGHLEPNQRLAINGMADFLDRRAIFTEKPSIKRALVLLSKYKCYLESAGTLRHSLRMWVTDIMYAYRINWHLKARR